MDQQQTLVLRVLIGSVPPDTTVSARMTAILTALEKDASAVMDIKLRPDPMKSSVAIDLLVNQEKKHLRDLLAKSAPELNSLVASFRATQEAARVAKAKLIPDQYAAETRSVFRALNDEGKNFFTAMAIQEKDSSSIAALVTVPAVISGMSAPQAADLRERFLDTIAPSSKDTADEMQAVVDTSLQVIESFTRPEGAAPQTPGTARTAEDDYRDRWNQPQGFVRVDG